STSDSAGDSDSATESSSSSVKPVPNQIQVYIADSQHSLDKVYRTLSITEDTDVTMNFTVVGSESAHYRIVRDGVEIMSGEVKQ
ncbi:serine/threonine protein kinase, partial [Lacticaseibacillus saniviri]|nr:serine/threonine protein kinase [Lacticaseibacillus saniviri]